MGHSFKCKVCSVDLGVGVLGRLLVWVGLRSHPNVEFLVAFFFLVCGGRDVVVDDVVGRGKREGECLRTSLRGGVVFVGDGVSVDCGVMSCML